MRRLALSALALVAASGCRQLLGLETPSVPSDAGGDGDALAGDAGVCFGATPYTICLAALPTNVLNLASTPIDTTICADGMLIDVDATATCVIVGASISVGPGVSAKGVHPLALLATGDLTISGQLDAASRLGVPGPGGRVDCQVPGAIGASNGNGGGGGAGGTYGTPGGDGGFGAGGVAAGGVAAPTATTFGLLGGCPGGAGGDGQGTSTAGLGGGAGGAVYLLAGGILKITGQVLAGGGGGSGGIKARGGGGGAGSGGLILLWSPNPIDNSGGLFANGGGGGGGATGSSNGGMGNDALASLMPALGGDGSGRGGQGCAATGAGGQAGTTAGAGAGGGGGGCGIIHVLGALLGGPGVVSPPAS